MTRRAGIKPFYDIPVAHKLSCFWVLHFLHAGSVISAASVFNSGLDDSKNLSQPGNNTPRGPLVVGSGIHVETETSLKTS